MVKQFRYIVFPHGMELLGIASLTAVMLWTAVPWGDNTLGIPGLGRLKIWVWTATLFPLVILWLISYFVKPVYIVGRYDFVAFPGYALLIGFAFAKIHQAWRRGIVLTVAAAILLGVPLVTKLWLYYQVPESRDARQTADFLNVKVANDDVIVFTGPRGHVLMYYLGQLGYHWESGVCQTNGGVRRFSCRFIPRDNEQGQLIYARPVGSASPGLRDEFQAVTASLAPSTGTAWLVFQRLGMTPNGRPMLDPDARLIEEVTGLGFRNIPELSQSAIYAFQR